MWFKTYILTIISVVLLSAIAESLMPETQMKKHISLVAGLIVLLAIAKPIVSIPKLSVDDIFFRLEDWTTVSSQEISKKITEAQYQTVDNTFGSALSDTITESINDSCNIKCRAEAVIDNGMVKYVRLNCMENSEIKNFVKQTYGLECVFEKDGG